MPTDRKALRYLQVLNSILAYFKFSGNPSVNFAAALPLLIFMGREGKNPEKN